jgi:hypothetical protein
VAENDSFYLSAAWWESFLMQNLERYIPSEIRTAEEVLEDALERVIHERKRRAGDVHD